MRRRYDRRTIIRWTRGFAILLFIHAGLVVGLAFVLLPSVRQLDWRALFPTPGYLLTQEGSLVYAALLVMGGVALWRLQRWGLLVVVTAVLLFSVPLALSQLTAINLTEIHSFLDAFYTFGPICIPFSLLGLVLFSFWQGLKTINR